MPMTWDRETHITTCTCDGCSKEFYPPSTKPQMVLDWEMRKAGWHRGPPVRCPECGEARPDLTEDQLTQEADAMFGWIGVHNE